MRGAKLLLTGLDQIFEILPRSLFTLPLFSEHDSDTHSKTYRVGGSCVALSFFLNRPDCTHFVEEICVRRLNQVVQSSGAVWRGRWAWALIHYPILPPSLICHMFFVDVKHYKRKKEAPCNGDSWGDIDFCILNTAQWRPMDRNSPHINTEVKQTGMQHPVFQTFLLILNHHLSHGEVSVLLLLFQLFWVAPVETTATTTTKNSWNSNNSYHLKTRTVWWQWNT